MPQTTQQRVQRLAYLKVHRPVLDLQHDVRIEVTVEGEERVKRLLDQFLAADRRVAPVPTKSFGKGLIGIGFISERETQIRNTTSRVGAVWCVW